MLNTCSLNLTHWNYNYKQFPPTPCFVHRVDAKPPVFTDCSTEYRSTDPCPTKQGFRLHGKIRSCYSLGLYLRTLANFKCGERAGGKGAKLRGARRTRSEFSQLQKIFRKLKEEFTKWRSLSLSFFLSSPFLSLYPPPPLPPSLPPQ